jgi:hypothetical protein
MPWSIIGICFAIGVGFLFLGNVDRIIWSLTQNGAHISGRVLDMHSRRTQPSDTYITFLPRVAFTDPGGVPREMSVKRGSTHYNFRKGDKVTVLWRAETQSIAIYVPFQRQFGTALVMWVFTIVGGAMFFASIWFTIMRGFARMSKKK